MKEYKQIKQIAGLISALILSCASAQDNNTNRLTAQESAAQTTALLSNTVYQANMAILDRQAWAESNRIRFGTNWQETVYGPKPMQPLRYPGFVTYINTNHLPREKLISMARRSVVDWAIKTKQDTNFCMAGFEYAMTNGFRGIATDGSEVYSPRPLTAEELKTVNTNVAGAKHD